MTHREVLLEAILDYPDDDLPRLAYADACEEEGDLVRANFIRAQCRLSRLERVLCHQPGAALGDFCDDSLCPRCGGWNELAQTEWRALESSALYWLGDFHAGIAIDPERFIYHQENGLVTEFGGAIIGNAIFRRGFVHEIVLTQEWFEQNAEALFNAHPIERVQLIDRVPVPYEAANPYIRFDPTVALPFTHGGTGDQVPAEHVSDGRQQATVFSWHYDLRLMDTPSYLAIPIWSRLDCEEMHAAFKRYRSREEANQALEVAALAYGKSLRKSKCSGRVPS